MRRAWVLALLAAVLLTAGVGLQQSRAIRQFRNPPVSAVLSFGERREVDGVAYQLTSFTHAAALPATANARDRYLGGMVPAITGAELVLVELTVERVDAGRDPEMVFCETTLADGHGRSWTTGGFEGDYDLERPADVNCGGGVDGKTPPLHQPYEVGFAFQVPADVVDSLVVRARLSGGPAGTLLLELRPR